MTKETQNKDTDMRPRRSGTVIKWLWTGFAAFTVILIIFFIFNITKTILSTFWLFFNYNIFIWFLIYFLRFTIF